MLYNGEMNRRGFLSMLIAGITLDPERLLWVPGKKLISIPAPTPVIQPYISYSDVIASQILRSKLQVLFYKQDSLLLAKFEGMEARRIDRAPITTLDYWPAGEASE